MGEVCVLFSSTRTGQDIADLMNPIIFTTFLKCWCWEH